MKKNFSIILIIIVIAIVIRQLPAIVHFYLQCCSPSKISSSLSSINEAVQIGYSIIYIIIAVVVLLVAYFQLDKTREATTIQTLVNLDYYIRSDDFLMKRKKLADIISINGLSHINVWLGKIKPGNELVEEGESLAALKNIFESVIYQFELIGHFYKKHIFSIEDVYQLFSIEIQNYWILMSEIGYIRYLRENESEDFYDKFENLFNDTLKQEIINDAPNTVFKYFLKLYYWTRTYRIFYFFKTRNKTSILMENIKKKIPLFLKEEKNLIGK